MSARKIQDHLPATSSNSDNRSNRPGLLVFEFSPPPSRFPFWSIRGSTRSARAFEPGLLLSHITYLDMLGSALFIIGQLPDRANGYLLNIVRHIVARDRHTAPAAHGQPAGSLARDIVAVANREPTSLGDVGLEMKRIARVFLDDEIINPAGQSHRLVVDGDKQTLRIQRASYLAITSQPGRTISARQAAGERPEILREGQLRQADFILNRESTGREGHLDRSIHPLVRNVVRVRPVSDAVAATSPSSNPQHRSGRTAYTQRPRLSRRAPRRSTDN